MLLLAIFLVLFFTVVPLFFTTFFPFAKELERDTFLERLYELHPNSIARGVEPRRYLQPPNG